MSSPDQEVDVPARDRLVDQHTESRAEELFKGGLALFRIRGQRLIYSRIHAPPPVEFGHVRLAVLSAEHLAADDLAALDEPVQLVGWLARTGCRTCDDRREALLADVEHVLAERARRLERVLPCPLDDPAPGEHCVPLGRRALQEAHDECAHPPFVGGVFGRVRRGGTDCAAARRPWPRCPPSPAPWRRTCAAPDPPRRRSGRGAGARLASRRRGASSPCAVRP